MLLHLGFFAAALLLSAELLVGSSKLLDEKVIFVKLTVENDSYQKDIDKSANTSQVSSVRKLSLAPPEKFSNGVKTKILKPKQSPQIKAERKFETEETDEKNNDFNAHDLNIQEEPANNVLLTSYESSGDEVVHTSSKEETTVNAFFDSFSSEDADKNRGILPAEIFELIRDCIEKVKTYPILARKRGIEGTVYISFRINPQGEPQNLKILKSSGSSILDTATLDIVKKAAPFPYVDSPVEVPVVFRLEN